MSVVVGIGLALITIVVPAASDARLLTVGAARATIGDGRRPIWMRLYVDVALLAAGGLVYWQAVRSGYAVVLAPEGVPTISLSTFTLMAPALFWSGAALFAWRLCSTTLARGRSLIRRAARPVAKGMSGVVASSMSRQRRSIARATILMALTASFALTVAVFNATYAAQAKVDAQLTNGADVSAMTTNLAGLPAGIQAQAATLPGVASATTMQHRFAYVGNDLQDLYGIDPATISATTPMSNAFFGNGDAVATLAMLAANADGVLLSDETVHDFQLTLGDTVRLRMQFASDGAYHVVPFTFVGIAREFPTAPHDSFIVANAAYVAKNTGTASVADAPRANDRVADGGRRRGSLTARSVFGGDRARHRHPAARDAFEPHCCGSSRAHPIGAHLRLVDGSRVFRPGPRARDRRAAALIRDRVRARSAQRTARGVRLVRGGIRGRHRHRARG